MDVRNGRTSTGRLQPYCFALVLIPLLLAVEYRVRIGPFSLALAECSSLLAASALILQRADLRLPARFRMTGVLMLATAAFAFPGVLAANDPKHALSAYRDLLSPLLLFAVLVVYRLKREEGLALVRVSVVVSAAVSVLGIVQFLTGQYQWALDPEYGMWQASKTGQITATGLGAALGLRGTLASGLCVHPNNFGASLVIPCLAATVLARTDRKSLRTVWLVAATLIFIGLCLTFARASFFTLICGALLASAARYRGRGRAILFVLAFAVALAAILGAILSPDVAWDGLGSFYGRLEMLQVAAKTVASRPFDVFTGGMTEQFLDNFGANQYIQTVHNVTVYLILQFGVFAAAAWTGTMIAAMRIALTRACSAEPAFMLLNSTIIFGVGATAFVYGMTTPLADSVQTGLSLCFWIALAYHVGDPRTRRRTVLISPISAPVQGSVQF